MIMTRDKRVLAAGMLAAFCASHGVAEQTLAERFLAGNDAIRTVRCDIRRETVVDGRRVKTLSRVWYARPDRLRVETVTPEPRRILVDGTNIYKWVEGHTEGVRLPLAEAPEAERLQVRKVPGTAEDYLLRLRGVPEQPLPPTEAFPVRRGYASPEPHPFAELAMDPQGRLGQVAYFSTAAQTNRLLQVEFGGWREAQPGLWFPCLQQATVTGPDGKTIRETVRVSAWVVNQPFDSSLFEVASAAKGVRFVSVDEMVAILAERKKK